MLAIEKRGRAADDGGGQDGGLEYGEGFDEGW